MGSPIVLVVTALISAFVLSEPRGSRNDARSTREAGALAFARGGPLRASIWTMNADGSARRRLVRTHGFLIGRNGPAGDHTHSGGPVWTPKGDALAYASQDHVYYVRTDRTFRVVPRGCQSRLTWSPDSRRLLCRGDTLWNIVDTDTGELLPGVKPGEGVLVAAWSPDGRTIAQARGRGLPSLLDVTTGRVRPIGLPPLGRSVLAIAWSPNSRRLALSTESDDGEHVLYVADLEKRTLRRLAEGKFAAWSPSGNRIAFQSKRHGNYDIFVIDADGSGESRVTSSPSAEVNATWRWQPR